MTDSNRRVIVFRSRLRPGVREKYDPRADEVHALAITMPGFVSSRDYISADGERLAVVEFAGADELAGWRDHPDHRRAQEEGRAHFYSEYRIQVCELLRESSRPSSFMSRTWIRRAPNRWLQN